jgi:hypothetical protein
MMIIMKDIESMVGKGLQSGCEIQDRGVHRMVKQIIKTERNLFNALNGWFGNYIQLEVSAQNALSMARVIYFALRLISEL